VERLPGGVIEKTLPVIWLEYQIFKIRQFNDKLLRRSRYHGDERIGELSISHDVCLTKSIEQLLIAGCN
jgi:hypothetical protein